MTEASSSQVLERAIARRGLTVRVVVLLVSLAAVVLAVRSLPGLEEISWRLASADAGGVAVIAVLELGSILGFVLALRGAFSGRPSWRVALALGTAEQAANVLLPAGGVGGLVLGTVVATDAGVPRQVAVSRMLALYLVTSAVTFAGIALGGLLAGPGFGNVPWYGATIPAAAACTVVFAVSRVAIRPGKGRGLARRVGASARLGVLEALRLIRQPERSLLAGSVAYFAFDVAALFAAFEALDLEAPSIGTFLLAYTLGQAGGILPLPGGVGGVDGGLIGVFVLYGTPLADVAAAVLTYRLLQLGLPVLCGLAGMAYLARRRRRTDPKIVAARFAHLLAAQPPLSANHAPTTNPKES